MSRSATHILIEGLEEIGKSGREIEVRGSKTKELTNCLLNIYFPRERCFVIPKRNDNIFAKIAETMWVLAGRNDMEFLKHYLPRAPEWSDDGEVWRGGYGPRLRAWEGIADADESYIGMRRDPVKFVDQFEQVVELLNKDPDTRRAVMIIFDPAEDFVDSKDIPCNNWLHFYIRDGKLNLNVAVRSQDVLWGFSGINTYEWSVLLEMMAFWTSTGVGTYTQFTSSMHLYERHYKRAETILEHWPHQTIYELGVPLVDFQTPFDEFDKQLNHWMDLEDDFRTGYFENHFDYRHGGQHYFADPFMEVTLDMIAIYNMYLAGVDVPTIIDEINRLPLCDFKLAAVEYFCRMDAYELADFDIPDKFHRFFRRCFAR